MAYCRCILLSQRPSAGLCWQCHTVEESLLFLRPTEDHSPIATANRTLLLLFAYAELCLRSGATGRYGASTVDPQLRTQLVEEPTLH